VLILLPTKYNPDEKGERQQVPIGDVQKTAVEILEKLELLSTVDPLPKVGLWKRLGIIDEVVKDVNVTLELDKVSLGKKAELIKYCRDVLLERFQQDAIHMRFIPEIIPYEVFIVKRRSQP
jgi:hypothetical protein